MSFYRPTRMHVDLPLAIYADSRAIFSFVLYLAKSKAWCGSFTIIQSSKTISSPNSSLICSSVLVRGTYASPDIKYSAPGMREIRLAISFSLDM